MTELSCFLQLLAIIGPSIAAVVTAYVAYKSLVFQKNSLLKRELIEQIRKTLQQLYALKHISEKEGHEISDDDFSQGIEKLLSETTGSIRILRCMNPNGESAEVDKLITTVSNIKPLEVNGNDAIKIMTAINLLNDIYRKEIT